MLLFFLLIVGLALFGCRVSFRGFREVYLAKNCTTAVNGVFILWVFMRHVQDYIAAAGYKLSGVIVVVYKYIPSNLLYFKINISTVAFATGSLLVLMKVRVHNRILERLGSHLFTIYVYQRLPMIILVAVMGNAFVKDFPHVFVGLSLALTLGLAACYRFWQIRLK